MKSRVESVLSAYKALGVKPEAGLTAAKKSFRDQVKNLHPDIAPATSQSLSDLADIVSAIRFLENAVPACMEIEISAKQAKAGIIRTLRTGEKSVLVRIPAGTINGETIAVISEPDIAVLVTVLAEKPLSEDPATPFDFGPLDDFIDEFSRPSPNTRFATWIRKAQNAA